MTRVGTQMECFAHVRFWLKPIFIRERIKDKYESNGCRQKNYYNWKVIKTASTLLNTKTTQRIVTALQDLCIFFVTWALQQTHHNNYFTKNIKKQNLSAELKERNFSTSGDRTEVCGTNRIIK